MKSSSANSSTQQDSSRLDRYSARSMYRAGRKLGRTRCFRFFAWPMWEAQAVSPRLEDTNRPGKVDEVFSAAEGTMLEDCAATQKRRAELDGEIKARQKDIQDTLSRMDDEEAGAVPESRLGLVPYLLIMLLVVASEFVINSLVFRLFGEDQLPTYVMALGVGVTVPVLAHLIGLYHKRGEHAFWVRFMAVGLVALLVVMVALRSFYLDASGAGSASTGVGVPTWVVSALFFFINAALVLCAIVAAHHRAIARPDWEARRRVLKENRRALTEAQAARDALETSYRTRCQRTIKTYKRLASAFHNGNMHSRRRGPSGSAEIPAWYKQTVMPQEPPLGDGPRPRPEGESAVKVAEGQKPATPPRTPDGSNSGPSTATIAAVLAGTNTSRPGPGPVSPEQAE